MGGNHAKLCPPSGWDRWSICSGSVDDQTGGGSVYADEGTAAHLLADTAFKAKKKAADYIGQRIWVPDEAGYKMAQRERFMLEVETDKPPRGSVWHVDLAMADPVQDYMDQVLIQERDYLQFETKVPIGHVTGEKDATGTCDALRAVGTTLASHDLKFGQGKEVYAKNNGQQLLYLLGGIEELDWYGEFENFEVHIHQPRLGHHDVWELTRAELEEWRERIREKGEAITVHGTREYKASPGGCMFCDIRRDCKTRDEFVRAGIAEGFPLLDDNGDPDEAGEEQLANETDHPQLLIDLDYVEMVEGWCKDKWAQANELVRKDAGALPGWGLFPGRGSRAFKDDKAARNCFRHFKLKVDQYAPRKNISAPQVEGIVGKKAFKEVSARYVDWKEGTPKLGRDTGKKAKVNTAEAMGFSDLDEEEKENG